MYQERYFDDFGVHHDMPPPKRQLIVAVLYKYVNAVQRWRNKIHDFG